MGFHKIKSINFKTKNISNYSFIFKSYNQRFYLAFKKIVLFYFIKPHFESKFFISLVNRNNSHEKLSYMVLKY